MDCNCNCFGIAASSKRPIKRYNLLVPDIFPRSEPSFTDKVDSSTERKIKKLGDYLEKNPHRGPKVSRRLARRVTKELRHQKYGYVKLAVRAYMHLLETLNDEDSSLFAKELVVQPVDMSKGAFMDKVQLHLNSVVGVLLRHNHVEIRTLGANLLATFIKVQLDLDYVEQIEAFVPMVCANILEHPLGLFQPSAENVTTLNVACLHVLAQHLQLCQRGSISPRKLEALENAVLDVLDRPISPLELEQEAEAEAVQVETARVEAARRQAVQAPAGLSPAGVGPRPSAPATLPSAVHRAGEGKAMGVRHVSIEDHEGHDRPEEGLHVLADAGSNKGRPDDVVRDKSATGMATVFEKSPFEEPVNPELDVHGSGSSDVSPSSPQSQPPSTDAAVQQQAAAAVGGAKNGALPEKQCASRGSFLHNLSNLPHAFTMSLRRSDDSGMERRDSTTSSTFAAVETPRTVALHVLELLGHMTKDAAEGKRIVEYLLRYLDRGHHWTNASGLVEVALGTMRKVCAEEHQRYLLFSALTRHSAAVDLTGPEQRRVVELGQSEGELLEGALASPALVLAIKELSAVLPSSEKISNEDQSALRSIVLACVRSLATHVGDSLHLLEALGGIVGKLPGPAPLSTAMLECVLAAALAVQSFQGKARSLPSRTFPQVFLQQCLGVMTLWEHQQRLLANDILVTLLPVASDGLRDAQVLGLLSAIWHQVAIPDNQPVVFVSISRLYAATTTRCSDAALVAAARLLLALRNDILAAESDRLDRLDAARCLAVLATCNCGLVHLAALLELPGLLDLQTAVGPVPHLRTLHDAVELADGLPFSPADAQAAARTLEALRGQHPGGAGALRRAADLFHRSPRWRQAAGDASVHEQLMRPFVGQPLSSLPPRIKPSGNAWGGSAGPAAHSPAGGDNTSRAVKRLKDMYARNVSQAALDKAPEAQGVRQLLAQSLAEAERGTVESAMAGSRVRHFEDVAAECKAASQGLHQMLAGLSLGLPAAKQPPAISSASSQALSLLHGSRGIYHLGLALEAF